MKILLLSDTHGYLDESILKYCSEADEIWHAGDFGNVMVADTIAALKPLKGVYGNIDSHDIRKSHPLQLSFLVEGLKVLMVHIGGYPGAWPEKIRGLIIQHKPDVFICGHSHILKITRDYQFNNMICMNPGAAGKSGFHQLRTMIRMEIIEGKIKMLEVIELGKR